MMRRVFSFLAAAAVVASFAAPLTAQSQSVTGTVVDNMCYSKQGAKATDAGHQACAEKCAKGGGAMVIVAGDAVYEISGDYTANSNAKLIEFAGKKVTATGDVSEAGGKKTIKVSSMKAAS